MNPVMTVEQALDGTGAEAEKLDAAKPGAYSEEQLQQIYQQVFRQSMGQSLADKTYIDHRYVSNDWDDEQFVSDMYEQWLSAVHHQAASKTLPSDGSPGQATTLWTVDTAFQQYLGECMAALRWRVDTELPRLERRGEIDLRTYQTAKDLVQRAMGAIQKYLELPYVKQLIGV